MEPILIGIMYADRFVLSRPFNFSNLSYASTATLKENKTPFKTFFKMTYLLSSLKLMSMIFRDNTSHFKHHAIQVWYDLFQAENLLWQISMHTQIRTDRYILK